MKRPEARLRPIWPDETTGNVNIIDQRRLPHELAFLELADAADAAAAIRGMAVRGAPLIGVTGAYGVYLAVKRMRNGKMTLEALQSACDMLEAARPTAVNLSWGVERMRARLVRTPAAEWMAAAREEAGRIAEAEVDNCRRIGEHGAPLLEEIFRRKEGKTVNVLTHCNAGWLACVEYGTATAPIYVARERGVDLHVWVDETRPLNQGARLTAWELERAGVRHTVITDNAGGHLMQHGLVDLVLVGTDRTTRTGDVANKIGTYLKALAAKDNGIPFYVALPVSTFDWSLRDGIVEIPIEERDPDEVRFVAGCAEEGGMTRVLVPPVKSPAANFAFDVTPARLVTGFITEKGICGASEAEILRLYPDRE
jgi:methylthioribose-1-phosphate isomerase